MEVQQDRTITLEDLAREAGVSVSTVSRALSGNPAINAATRARIVELAGHHGYDAPVRRPRKRVQGGALSIAVVLAPQAPSMPRPFDPFSLSLIGGIGAAMRERGLPLTISPITPGDQAGLTQLLEDEPHDGVILLGQSMLHTALNRSAGTLGRFVVWGAEAEDQRYCSVGSDNLRGGQRAAAHLARLGRRRIAFLGATATYELQQRRSGYEKALRDADLPFDAKLVRECALDPDGAIEAVDDLLDSGVEIDAIVAGSDLAAIGAMRALARRGISVPGDVAVVGYDDIELAGHTHPALTTIRQDTMKAGRLLVAKLMRLIDGFPAQSERLETELIVRESCGA